MLLESLLIFVFFISTVVLVYLHRKRVELTISGLESKFSNQLKKVSDEFSLVYKDLNIIEREVDYYKKQKDKLGNMGLEFRKFLTPKGKIKKQHTNNPLAQKCYEKFQVLILK